MRGLSATFGLHWNDWKKLERALPRLKSSNGQGMFGTVDYRVLYGTRVQRDVWNLNTRIGTKKRLSFLEVVVHNPSTRTICGGPPRRQNKE